MCSHSILLWVPVAILVGGWIYPQTRPPYSYPPVVYWSALILLAIRSVQVTDRCGRYPAGFL